MNLLKRIVPWAVKERIRSLAAHLAHGAPDAMPSFAHAGEDRVLNYLFKRRRVGFYVDVGAYHPTTSSNTMLFYRRGWRGINIDACPGSMRAFERCRPRDANVEAAVSDQPGTLTYYRIGTRRHEMNSLAPEFQTRLYADFDIDPASVRPMEVRAMALRDILDAHLPVGVRTIDFLSVDVEGYEMHVLASNDWERYRPIVVMLEHHAEMTAGIFEEGPCRYMAERGYRLIAKTPNEIVFLEKGYSLDRSGFIVFPDA